MTPPPKCFLKYDEPILINKKKESKLRKAHRFKGISQFLPIVGTVPAPPPSPENVHRQENKVLDKMFPPREWTENNKQWVQYVSASPSGRLDVIHLLEDLQLKLVERNAHELGLCPVRQELYKDCFDEIIRQVTVGCAERGQLLMRVREECEKIIATYQTLYESSMAYSMRKALQAEQDRIDLAKKISELESDKRDLERLLSEQRAACEALEKSETDRRHSDEKKHSEEIDFFKQTIKQLKGQLEGFSGPKKTK